MNWHSDPGNPSSAAPSARQSPPAWPSPQGPPAPPQPRPGLWKRCLWGGIALWLLTAIVTYTTRNSNLLPTLILLGSFLVPAAFVLWAYERHGRDLGATAILGCFLTGGILGVLGASGHGVLSAASVPPDVPGRRPDRGGRQAPGPDVRAPPPPRHPRHAGRAGARRDGRIRVRRLRERGVRLQRRRHDEGHRSARPAGDRGAARGARTVRARALDRDHAAACSSRSGSRTGVSASPRP